MTGDDYDVDDFADDGFSHLETEDEDQDENEDTGRYENGYRIYRNGTMREDFGSDR